MMFVCLHENVITWYLDLVKALINDIFPQLLLRW